MVNRWRENMACPQGSTSDVSVMLARLAKLQVRLQTPERGATAVEYALMVALIAVVLIVAVKLLGTNLSSLFNKAATSI
jgi:pilus assembly protein Flp/PilA